MVLVFYAIIFFGFHYILCIVANENALISQQHEVITTNKKADGLGAQIQQIIANIIYAELHNKEFCYRPLEKMQHNYDNDPDFIAKKERFLNFIGNFLTIEEANEKNYNIISDNYIPFFDNNIILCANSISLKKIKEIFRANKNVNNYFNNNSFNIAVHIRRRNPHDTRTYGTDVPDKIYVKVINKLRTKYRFQNPLFHIYSQGNIENFNMYNAPDIIFHLNEPIEDTYLAMVFADVLVTGRSSFSYTAGYLSNGIVYYNSYVHAPLPHWISVEKLLSEQ